MIDTSQNGPEKDKIEFDLDRDRIRAIVTMSWDFVFEMTQCSFNRTRESVMEELEAILLSNRISDEVFLDFSNDRLNDLRLRVNLRRRKVLAISERFTKKKQKLNGFLRTL